jgi:GTP cyclohydrolase II
VTETTPLEFYAETLLPTELGEFRLRAYRAADGDEPVAIVVGDVAGAEAVPVRVHSACFTSETLGSLRCDCREQLQYAMEFIQREGGVVLYLHQEGRGIGLGNKIRAYALQELGHDTVDANRLLGLPDDSRSYEDAAQMLQDLGVGSIRLMTNNPAKIEGLKRLGVEVVGRIPVLVETNGWSAEYLEAKRQRMGHMLAKVKQASGQ